MFETYAVHSFRNVANEIHLSGVRAKAEAKEEAEEDSQ